jgi:pyruvate,water dikinase
MARMGKRAVITFEEIVKDKGYPGYDPVKHLDQRWATEKLSLFRPEDVERFWFMGFQWPRAYPLNFVWLEDGFAWGTQSAANGMPLPPSDGLAPRVAGVHVYGSNVPVSNWVIGQRGPRAGKMLPGFLQNFPEIWNDRRTEIIEGLRYFETIDLNGKSPAELWQIMEDARSFHVRAWEIHFELMYPLTANYLGFYGLCRELGIEAADIPKFLQGYETQPMKSDRELWNLANEARGTEAEKIISAANEPRGIYRALQGSTKAASWLKKFDAFLEEFGRRSDRVVDVTSPAWIEDPSSPLGTIKSLLQSSDPYAFDKSHKSAVEEREAKIDHTRSRLTKQEQATFDQALQSCTHANFAWWNDDHNWYIDMRCTWPIRRIALEIAKKLDFTDPEEIAFLFYPEIRDVIRGKGNLGAARTLIKDRKDYFKHWDARRREMPNVLGTPPDTIIDPVVIEIFGITDAFLELMKKGDVKSTTLKGVAASPGKVTGPARVLHGPDELHRLQSGDILVCEGTTPTWTPAFTKIAGCVCDLGGTLTHASVVSREYRVPCVVGTGLATQAITDGEQITVDGDQGIVTVHRASKQ